MSPARRLTDDQARAIRKLRGSGRTKRSIAAEFGVGMRTVGDIWGGHSYRHLWGAPALERPAASTVWELRTAWATRARITVTLDPEIAELSVDRVRGVVTHVASTGLYCLMTDAFGEIHVPLAAVLSIRRPHFTEPADDEPALDPDGQIPGQGVLG